MSAKVVALDYGQRRMGVAVGDEEIGVAAGLATIEFSGWKQLHRQLQDLVAEQQPEQFLVGYPLNMDGTRGEQCEAVENFTRRLKGWFARPIILWDERLTTAQAGRIQREAGVTDRRARARGLVDRAAAVLLLQSWLDSADRSGIPWGKEEESTQ